MHVASTRMYGSLQVVVVFRNLYIVRGTSQVHVYLPITAVSHD